MRSARRVAAPGAVLKRRADITAVQRNVAELQRSQLGGASEAEMAKTSKAAAAVEKAHRELADKLAAFYKQHAIATEKTAVARREAGAVVAPASAAQWEKPLRHSRHAAAGDAPPPAAAAQGRRAPSAPPASRR